MNFCSQILLRTFIYNVLYLMYSYQAIIFCIRNKGFVLLSFHHVGATIRHALIDTARFWKSLIYGKYVFIKT